jgi:hypothetical protein
MARGQKLRRAFRLLKPPAKDTTMSAGMQVCAHVHDLSQEHRATDTYGLQQGYVAWST